MTGEAIRRNSRRLAMLLLVAALFAVVLAPAYAAAGQASIFIYHRFGEGRYPSTNVEIDQFAAHMRHLHDTGKTVLPLYEVVSLLEAGRDLPRDAVVLTVDDAFVSFQQGAMPILRRYGYPVTLFVNTDGVGARGYLDWDQLRQLVREGVAIGNHTATHDYLLERKSGETHAAWKQRIIADIGRAQEAFERELGLRPEIFAYPYGEYSPELVRIVRELGFRAAVAQQSGVVSARSDLFLLPRFPMGGAFASLRSFSDKAAMRPFEVEVLSPQTPVLTSGAAPVLKLRVVSDRYDLGRIQGFVQGDNALRIALAEGGGEITVQAEKALTGRRNKYTLTVPLKDGSGWAWFSHPWFRPGSDP